MLKRMWPYILTESCIPKPNYKIFNANTLPIFGKILILKWK